MGGISRMRRGAAVGALVGLLALVMAVAASGAITSTLVSVNSNGVAANGYSSTNLDGNISGSGRFISFDSDATNLPGGSGSYFLTYLRDLQTGKTTLMAKDNNGDPATGAAVSGGISANGNIVTFEGNGTGLPGADGTHPEVWVHDVAANQTILVSRANNGEPAQASDTVQPSASATGRYVVFEADATNLPSGGMHAAIPRIYMRDLQLGKTTLVSKASDGRPVYGFLCGQSISGDGSRIVFRSDDPKLPGANGYKHIYMRDLGTGRTTLIDRRSDGVIASGGDADCPSISEDGRFVVFSSRALNLPGVTSSAAQTFRRDTQANKLALVSRNAAGDPANGDAIYGHPSADARYVTFQARATNLPGGNMLYDQAYVRDIQKGHTLLLSRAGDGSAANNTSDDVSISADGRWAAFESPASNLGATPPDYSVFRSGPIH
jgi:Tol biopolymer transport system component